MPKFRLENHRTRDVLVVEASDVKTAHEFGQARWTGEVVSVEEINIYQLKQEWQHTYSRLLKELARAKENVSYPLDNALVKHQLLSAREFLEALINLHE